MIISALPTLFGFRFLLLITVILMFLLQLHLTYA